MSDSEIEAKNGCCCEPYPIGDGPERMCPVHGQWPGAFGQLGDDGTVRLDLRSQMQYLGIKPEDVVYLELHTAREYDPNPMLVPEGPRYPRQSMSWSSANAHSGAVTVVGFSVGDASAPEYDDTTQEEADDAYGPVD